MKKSVSVFVIDDDASTRVSMQRLLKQRGFGAVVFDSSKAFFDHDDFSQATCFVIDIDLDGQSGIDLRRSLAKSGITAPVIFVTGNDSEADRLAAVESGCIAYLKKPFAAKSFIEAVTRACAVAV